jgi:hypothetical protein
MDETEFDCADKSYLLLSCTKTSRKRGDSFQSYLSSSGSKTNKKSNKIDTRSNPADEMKSPLDSNADYGDKNASISKGIQICGIKRIRFDTFLTKESSMDQNGIVISLLINVVIFFLLLYTADKRY